VWRNRWALIAATFTVDYGVSNPAVPGTSTGPPPSVWIFSSVAARSPSWVRMNLDDLRGLLESLFEARNVSSSP
jgi:hypothetical protein